jgi:hypothetical protein
VTALLVISALLLIAREGIKLRVGMELATRRRERDDSEGVRLFQYVKYLSPQTPKDDRPQLL